MNVICVTLSLVKVVASAAYDILNESAYSIVNINATGTILFWSKMSLEYTN